MASETFGTEVTGGFGLLGAAGSIFGGLESASGAKAKFQAEENIAGLEMQANNVRRQAMELSARRQQLQNVRNAQQAQSMALASAVNSGAQFSSSAQSGQRQANAQAAYSNEGVSQNLQFGEQIFNIDNSIDQQKIAEAQAESQISSGQGLSSIFGAIGSQAGNIGKLATLLPIGL